MSLRNVAKVFKIFCVSNQFTLLGNCGVILKQILISITFFTYYFTDFVSHFGSFKLKYLRHSENHLKDSMYYNCFLGIPVNS